MLIGTDAMKTVVPVYHLITCIHPSPSEMQVCKCWGQFLKEVIWQTVLGISYRTWVNTHSSLCNTQGEFIAYKWALHKPVTLFKRLPILVHEKWWQQGHKLHLILDFRLFAWSTFCLGIPALDLLLGFDASMPTLLHKTVSREAVMVPMYLIPG